MSDEKDPVRVGRFEWERLMLMSVPHPTNFKLLPLGVFMSADGGRVRPGNASLSMFGPHEKTWAKLLRWAVAEGWLVQVARGGARRGPNGTTIVRASVYAASAPQSVWERRMEILGAPPFRAAGVEGSASDPLKGASGDSQEAPDPLKGALDAPFNTPGPSLKGASRDSLPESLKGAPEVFEGSDPSFEGSVSGFEGSAQTLPHHVVLSSRSDSSSTSSTTSVAEDSSTVTDTVTAAAEGGGGGESESRSIAEMIVAALDYRGQQPNKQQQQTLTDRLAAALDGGWTVDGLAEYLALKGKVDSAYALYAYRLKADVLPEPAQPDPYGRDRNGFPTAESGSVADLFRDDPADDGMWARAAARADARSQPLVGTDARVQGWLDLNRQLAAEELSTADQRVLQGQVLAEKFRAQEEKAITGSRAYSNDAFHRPANPAEAARIPHCGDPYCDPVTRLVQREDDNGLRSLTVCGNCHPAMKF